MTNGRDLEARVAALENKMTQVAADAAAARAWPPRMIVIFPSAA